MASMKTRKIHHGDKPLSRVGSREAKAKKLHTKRIALGSISPIREREGFAPYTTISLSRGSAAPKRVLPERELQDTFDRLHEDAAERKERKEKKIKELEQKEKDRHETAFRCMDL